MEPADLRTRLELEFAALDARIDSLDKFIGYDPAYQELSAVSRGLLMIQRDAMRAYASCLSTRLDLLEKEKADA